MSSDLVAWVVAIGLGVAVVGLGLRRNLGDATRSWLPRPEGTSEQETAMRELYEGRERRRRPMSPRQRRWFGAFCLLFALTDAAHAVLSADSRVFNAIFAALFALGAVAIMLKKWPPPVDGSFF